MNTLTKLFSRQCYRSIPFWLLVLLALYSALGFIVLPKIIHNTITEQVNTRLGWQTEIQKIEFNPFLLTLTIEQLAITENKEASLSFTHFHADFELRSIIEGAYTFKNIELIDPNFHLQIDENGITNLQQALIEHPQIETDPAPVTDAAPSAIPKLLFDDISVKNGALSATDASRGEIIKHQLNPISFNLRSFSTFVEKGGDYQLQMALDDNQSFDWKGNIAVAPIASQGSFTIKGIKIERFWPYLEQFSPYQLRKSSTNLQANYALSYIDDRLQLQLNEAFITVNDIELADQQKSSPFINIKQIKIGPTKFDLLKQSVAITKIAIDTFNLEVVRDKSGELELLAPLNVFLAKNETEVTEATPQQEKAQTTPFLWSIDDIVVNNSAVQITDNFVQGGHVINIHNIGAKLSVLNQSLTNQQPFEFAYQVESSGENSFLGQLVAQPFSLNSQVKLSQLPITLIQPYIAEIAHISIDKGELSVDADVVLSIHDKDGLSGKFTGNIEFDDFESRDTLNDRRLLGWEKLAVTPLSINLSPLAIDIKKIALDKPYSRLVITEDRKVNFSQLMIENKTQSPTTQSSEPGPKIDIGEIMLKDGGAYFADLSLQPQFSTSIEQLNGEIKGLSSNNLESADVDIKGRVEEYGKVSIVGKINPLAGDLTTDINVNFDKIELTTMTPYSGRYAGYVIDKGKLSLDLNYKIANGILDGNNRLILDQFELGEKVNSEEAVDLPLKLALALFKDSDGIIDISLPTKGDMNSPDFEIGGIVMKALVNVLTKAITAPFSLLANIVGGDEDSLNAVSFTLGSATLDNEQKQNLKTVAALLTKRPQLILEMRVNVDGEQERKVLQQQAVTMLLDLNNKDPQQKIDAMELLFTQQTSEKELLEFKNKLVTAKDKQLQVDETAFNQQYQQALFDHLVLLQPVTNLQLSELAQQRISIIKNELIKVNRVDNKQVFALQPSLNGRAEDTLIETIFSLNTK